MINKVKNMVKSKIFINSFWLVLLQGFNTILPLITLPYITRLLSTSSYGQFTIALNIIGYLQVVVEYGFGLSGAKAIAIDKSKENINKLFTGIIIGRLFLFFLCCLFVICFSSVCNSGVLLLCVIILLSMVFSTVFQLTWLFQGMQDMKYITFVNVVGRLVSVVLIFALVKSPNHLLLYCILYASSYFLTNLLAIFIAIKKYGVKFLKPRIDSVTSILKDGWHVFVSTGITKVFAGIGVTVLAFYATESIVGIYGAILKIPTILNMLVYPISQSIYPEISVSFSKAKTIGLARVKKIFLPVFVFFLIVGFLILVFRFETTNVLFGISYARYSNILIPLTFWFLFGVINNFLGVQILIASGEQKLYSRLFVVSSIFLLILNIVLGKFGGIYGVSFACLISESVLFLMLLVAVVFLKRKWMDDEKHKKFVY